MKPQKTQTMVLPFKGLVFITYYVKKKKKKNTHIHIWWYTNLEKSLMLGKTEGRRRGRQYEMVGWHHWLKGHKSEQTPGDSEGWGSLACYLPPTGSQRVKHDLATEQLNNSNTILSKTQFLPWTQPTYSPDRNLNLWHHGNRTSQSGMMVKVLEPRRPIHRFKIPKP